MKMEEMYEMEEDESLELKSDNGDYLKDGLSSREEMSEHGYGHPERIETRKTK